MTHAPDPCLPADVELDQVLGSPEDHPWELDQLLGLWRSRQENRDRWSWTIEVYRRISHRFARLGDPVLAYDVAKAGLKCWPDDLRLRQLQALALVRSGDTRRAHEILTGLYDDLTRRRDVDRKELEETIGLLARTEKDLGLAATDPERRDEHLRRAGNLYAEGYDLMARSWTGINAAVLAILLGEAGAARDLAGRVYEQCLQELDRQEGQGRGDTYWPLATLGEAALILGRLGEAETWYGRAVKVGRGHWGDLNATRSQAHLLASQVGVAPAEIDRWFRIPIVVVFVGHMVDRAVRPTPRFPPHLVPDVRAAIRRRLEGQDAIIGYASAACGSDILFLQSVLEKNQAGGTCGGTDDRAYGEAHVVLPYHRDQFRKDSVAISPGTDWGMCYDEVLSQSEVLKVSEYKLDGGVSFEYANRVLHGLALMQAKRLETRLLHLAVWDGRPGDGPAGTASTVEHWRKMGHDVEVLDLAGLRSGAGARWTTHRGERRVGPQSIGTAPISEFGTEILAIFFADVVGFSKLTEEQIPLFVRHFLGLVAATLAGYETVKKNTWGDGLYLVFRDVRAAGHFALELRDRIVSIDWRERGFPSSLGLRIALHAGPVFHCRDPVTDQSNCIGTHVSHAARIEPITPPNQVYASQAFAALAESEGRDDFTCHYVGMAPLAKGYGTYPTYHVEGHADRAAYRVDRRPS